MTPGQFLRLVWPDTGFYCISHPFRKAGIDHTLWRNEVFSTISGAVTHCLEQKHTRDVYFAVGTLAEEKVWDPERKNPQTGEKGKWVTRIASNMAQFKAAFLDLDVGEGKPYPDQPSALRALVDFAAKAQLPLPMLISSGRGVHVYWLFEQPVERGDWLRIAANLHMLAKTLGLKADPQRVEDAASVLRVVGTFNYKDPDRPLPVKLLQRAASLPAGEFETLVNEALIRAGEPLQEPRLPSAADFGSNMNFEDFGPAPTLEDVTDVCLQAREMVRVHADPHHPYYGQFDNNAWYKGMLPTIRHVADGEEWCRKLTALRPRTHANIDDKLQQLEKYAPARCSTIREVMPWNGTPCENCRFLNDPGTPNPIVAARKGVPAPPPVIELRIADKVLESALIPNPPKPFERLKTGGIAVTRTNSDGETQTTTIYANDLYPIRRLVNKVENTEQQLWRVHLPRTGAKDFMIDADTLYDGRKFCSAMAHNGIYPGKGEISALQDYMVAYISQLQKDIDADQQVTHLGWSDGYRQFVLPDKTLLNDGAVRPSSLTRKAQTSSQFVTKAGSLEEQVRIMRFWNHAAYLPNQFAILASLGSILLHMTGQHGLVINMSGESGAAKSTTLYSAMSAWGHPTLWPINGTNRGATANGRAQRVVANSNLPTGVDEITHIPVKEAQDLVMNVTQPGGRIRLDSEGAERQTDSGYKSAIMLSTANSSLHALLSMDNTAGTAGSMRVFEMLFRPQKVHTKAEADEFRRLLEQNYGWIGEQFAAFVVQHYDKVAARVREMVRRVDVAARTASSERYWSAAIAVAYVSGEICRALGLFPYDPDELLDWALRVQIPYMRGVVSDEYRDPLAILTDYIALSAGNILVVDRSGVTGINTAGRVAPYQYAKENDPRGALLGHYDLSVGVLYLLKQAFKDHCAKVGASSHQLLNDLSTPRPDNGARIVVDKARRFTLGQGTTLSKGQSWVFVIDMKHPEVAGVELASVAGDENVTPSAPAGNLRVV